MALYTHRQIAEYLRVGYWLDNGYTDGFGFADRSLTFNTAGLSASARSLARQALKQIEDLTGLSFSKTDGSAQITFHEPSTTASGANVARIKVAPDGSLEILSSSVHVGSGWLAAHGTSIESYSFQTYLHEISHALGLGHGGDYGGGATYGVDNHYDNDSWQTSMMSYFDQRDATAVDATRTLALTPQTADILALQAMYGAGPGRAGDTVYGYGSTAGPPVYDAARTSGVISYTIWDAGGTDTLDYSGSATDDRIDLRAAAKNSPELYASNIWGEVGNVMIAPGVVIENAIGGAGANTIVGNSARNRLDGGGGRDRLSGGGGDDRVSGQSGDDLLRGGGGQDRIYGGSGKDSIFGGDGNDVVGAGSDDDDVFGGAGEDRLYGSSGDDVLHGDTGADVVDGQAGSDEVFGGSGKDKVFGGSSGDILDGGGENDLLSAGPGDDVLSGGDGADRLYGSTGDDVLDGGRGDDLLRGGRSGEEESDTFVFAGTAFGNDEVINFDAVGGDNGAADLDQDLIILQATAASDLDDLQIINSGNDVIIRVAGQDDSSVTLRDVAWMNIDEADFLFA